MNRLLLALAFVVPLRAAAAHAAPDASAEPPKTIAGVWESETEPRGWVRFETARCTRLEAGKEPEFYRALYEAALARLFIRDQTIELRLEPTPDGRLAIEGPEGRRTFRKIERAPDGLDPKPIRLGTETLAPDAVASIGAELALRSEEDQSVRKADELDFEAMRVVDEDNTVYLRGLLERYGWIDAPRFGPKISNDAFLIVQHSPDLALMLAALPEIEKDVKAKRVDSQMFALLYDRTRIRLGYRQRYGTQCVQKAPGGSVKVLPLEDREHVEDIRKEIGLFPFTTYLDMLRRGKTDVTVEFLEN